MYKKYYWILLLLLFSCKNKFCETNEICKEKVYTDEYGYCVFPINDKFYTIKQWDEDFFDIFPTDDSIRSSQTNRIFYKQILNSCNLEYDTIEMANCIEIPRHNIGFLYNLRIVDTNWEVALYYPSGEKEIKGTYSFNITRPENKIFKGVLNKFKNNAKENYYPIQNNSLFFQGNPAPAIYLKIQSKQEQTEYFGPITPISCDSVANFDMLSQITTIILRDHILYDSKDNKISDTIMLLDIRKRFDFYVSKDCCTGFVVKDFDNLIPPPSPN